MVLTCCVKGCKSESYKGCNVSFHRFPKNEEMNKKWLDAIPGNVTQYSAVCGLHFKAEDFETNPVATRKMLKANAIPSINPVPKAELSMGAKTSEQVNKSRSTVKCDVCGRRFMNLQALISHKKFLHTRPDTARRAALKKQENARLTKKVIPINMLKRVNPPTPAKQAAKSPVDQTRNLAGKDTDQPKKPHFECPVCFKKFPVYFTAFRHIQKNASCCIDEKGAKVSPNSTSLVKPIRIEICSTCKDETRSTEPHDCPKSPSSMDQYECLGCKQVFNGLLLYQHHVKGLHSDGAQNYFFPGHQEFTSWKKSLQEQTKVEYTRLNRQKSKEVYHCSHQPAGVTDNTQLCPSMIIARAYSKGVHVSYLTDHQGHTVDSSPIKKYSEYAISLYLRDLEDLKESTEDSDLYSQFKNIIMSVAHGAAKADMSTLKELIEKALEMTALLKNLNKNDHNVSTVKKKLSDAQISKTLDSLQMKTGKRKQSVEVKETKRDVAKRIKRNSVAIEDTVENNIATKSKAAPITKSVTFRSETVSDSELSQDGAEDTLETMTESIKEVHKTIKKTDNALETSTVTKVKDDSKKNKLQSPSFNDTYMNFVDQNFKCKLGSSTPKVRPPIKKKEIMKTKIGQFKVKSLSPKEPGSPKSPKQTKTIEVKEITTPKNWTTKDIKYEVKEQENDYNILILKI